MRSASHLCLPFLCPQSPWRHNISISSHCLETRSTSTCLENKPENVISVLITSPVLHPWDKDSIPKHQMPNPVWPDMAPSWLILCFIPRETSIDHLWHDQVVYLPPYSPLHQPAATSLINSRVGLLFLSTHYCLKTSCFRDFSPN